MDCHWFNINHCRSCELLDRSYAETLTLKEEKLKSLFPGVTRFLKPTVGLKDKVSGSRNKAKLAAFAADASDIQFGFYDGQLNFKGLESCPLHMQGLNELLPVLKKKLLEYNILPYSLIEKKGELKYLILSKGQGHNDLLVRFVLRSKESLDRLKKMSKVLQTEIPEIKVVTANFQPEHKAILEGEEEIVISDVKNIVHQFDGISLNLGPRSFFQVTPEIAGQLYGAVGKLVKENHIKSFLDLFCGVGAFSFFAAQNCPDVYGVEISKEAIACAESSIKDNQVAGKIKFEALDVEEFLKAKRDKYDAILVNPPRRGLNPSIIRNILENDPRVIIYSSCNVDTLARDFELLKVHYDISHAQIFDMFPYTEHFETLIYLNRKDV